MGVIPLKPCCCAIASVESFNTKVLIYSTDSIKQVTKCTIQPASSKSLGSFDLNWKKKRKRKRKEPSLACHLKWCITKKFYLCWFYLKLPDSLRGIIYSFELNSSLSNPGKVQYIWGNQSFCPFKSRWKVPWEQHTDWRKCQFDTGRRVLTPNKSNNEVSNSTLAKNKRTGKKLYTSV